MYFMYIAISKLIWFKNEGNDVNISRCTQRGELPTDRSPSKFISIFYEYLVQPQLHDKSHYHLEA